MKKILSVLLCGVLLGVLCLPAAAAEPKGIATPEDLKAMGENPRGTYRLEADIDLGGVDWVPIPFSGVLDGNGHTLYNLHIRETGAERATRWTETASTMTQPTRACFPWWRVLRSGT